MLSPDVSGENAEGFKVTMVSRGHQIIADEPTEIGGSDKGAKPSELLLASLASCKLITLRMYAERKGWELGEISIALRYLEKGEPTLVEKEIRFSNPLNADQVKRLIEISGRCPVAKMLKSSIAYKIV